MRAEELLSGLADAGDRMVTAAEGADLDATVPTCPEWTVRDLVFHLSGVHRWATSYVRDAVTEPVVRQLGGDPLADADDRPDDDKLLGWFREGHAQLLAALGEAPADLQCWSFLPAPSPLTFWARRQAHETTVHRVDAELAATGDPSPVDPALATDGIDELVSGFVIRRRGKLRSENPATVGIHTTDTDAHWHLTITDGPVVTERADRPADTILRGTAQDTYLALWNRLPLRSLDVTGDHTVLDQWPELVQIRWG